MSQVPNTIAQGTWPACLVLPSNTGSTNNCLQVAMPSMTTIILVLIISWLIFMAVAYAIFYVLRKSNPNMKYSYWIILIILIVAGIIVSLLSKLF